MNNQFILGLVLGICFASYMIPAIFIFVAIFLERRKTKDTVKWWEPWVAGFGWFIWVPWQYIKG